MKSHLFQTEYFARARMSNRAVAITVFSIKYGTPRVGRAFDSRFVGYSENFGGSFLPIPFCFEQHSHSIEGMNVL